MKEIEAIKQALAAYDAADCGSTEQRAILDIEGLASPSLFKAVLAHIEAQQVEIERLRTLLICVEVNLSKSMSKSIQRLQARTIREVLSETP